MAYLSVFLFCILKGRFHRRQDFRDGIHQQAFQSSSDSYLRSFRMLLLSYPAFLYRQPFRPLVAMPSMKYRCRARKTTETGTRETTDAAMIRW